MQGLLGPVQGMVDDLVGFLPNILSAGVIAVVGWFVARIIRQVVTGLLVAIGADSLGERMGMSAVVGNQTLSNLVGTIVHTLILIPVIISSLDALAIEAISGPATGMLDTLLNAIPLIFGAMIILGITYFVAGLISGLVVNILTTVGFNRILPLIGLGGEPEEGQRTPSEIIGHLVTVALMLFATIEASQILGFTILADLTSELLTFASQVLLGVVVIGLGLYLANLVSGIIASTAGAQAALLARIARVAIIVLTVAMGLGQMGIAEDIVNMAFGLILGAIAVAAALAFGLGSRDTAGEMLDGWLTQLRGDDSE